MKTALTYFLFLMVSLSFSQKSNFIEQEVSIDDTFTGTLLAPELEKPPLAILLAGSGPLDKDGNTNFLKGNMLKKLAETLSNAGIATFRYDKHSLRQIKKGNYTLDYTFDAFVKDAKAALSHLKSDRRFGKIFFIGHSQGSLVGMLAANNDVDGFISIAGAGQSIDQVITHQINASSPQFTKDTKRVFNIMKKGETTDDFPAALASIFNKETQPFMMSWMKYNPQKEIKKLKIPVLIINGNNDIQVTVEEADLLHKAAPSSKSVIVENMNHALVIYDSKDRLGNIKSYNESSRPLSKELINVLVDFIK